MYKDVCIVIPIYKIAPSPNELQSIRRCFDVFNDRDIAYIAPLGLDIAAYPQARVMSFNGMYFSSTATYSELCRSKELYSAFSEYKYILIYQSDCWVFSDTLDWFTALGYDYIGAPWFGVRDISTGRPLTDGQVGNGGLSLRKTATFLRLAGQPCSSSVPEDVYWCRVRASELNIAPTDVACRFSLEHHPERGISINGGRLPMGCHKPWQLKYSNLWYSMGVPKYKD